MVEVRSVPARFFDRGIDSIVGSPAAPESLQLPGGSGLAPAAQAHESALNALLGVTNLDSLVDAAVQPEAVDVELLMPVRFQAVLEAAQAHLHAMADARRLTNPPMGRLLAEAAAVLDEEAALRELLQTYLRTLVQG